MHSIDGSSMCNVHTHTHCIDHHRHEFMCPNETAWDNNENSLANEFARFYFICATYTQKSAHRKFFQDGEPTQNDIHAHTHTRSGSQTPASSAHFTSFPVFGRCVYRHRTDGSQLLPPSPLGSTTNRFTYTHKNQLKGAH